MKLEWIGTTRHLPGFKGSEAHVTFHEWNTHSPLLKECIADESHHLVQVLKQYLDKRTLCELLFLLFIDFMSLFMVVSLACLQEKNPLSPLWRLGWVFEGTIGSFAIIFMLRIQRTRIRQNGLLKPQKMGLQKSSQKAFVFVCVDN